MNGSAADRFAHSRYSEIRSGINRLGKNDTGSDITIREILKHPELLELTNKVRVGVEGMSERLRALVRKPYTDDEIVTFCRLVADAGIKSMDWYMIYGLPTEMDMDVGEFTGLICKLDKVLPENYTIAIHWNAFQPNAQTPFQWAVPAIGERKALSAFFASRPNKRIRLTNKPAFTSDWTMIRRLAAVRSGESTKKLIYNFAVSEGRFKRNPRAFLKAFEEAAGYELMAEWARDKPLPWDAHCVYERDRMSRLWEKARLDGQTR